MAQLVEHMLGKHEVTSSNLVISSKNLSKLVWKGFYFLCYRKLLESTSPFCSL